MTPPRVSPFFRTSSISATMRSLVAGVGAAHRVLVDARVVVRAGQHAVGHLDRADGDDVADHLDADRLAEERLRDGAEGDPGRGLPGAGPLQHGAGVVEAVLLHAGEVGVAGPRAGQRGVAGLPGQHVGVDRVGRHDRRPLRPLGVAHLDRDRPALRAAVPDPAGEGDLVLLEGHACAPAVAQPAAGQLHVDVGGLHLDAGRQPLEDRGELLTMGLACGQPAQHARDSASRPVGPRPDAAQPSEVGAQRESEHRARPAGADRTAAPSASRPGGWPAGPARPGRRSSRPRKTPASRTPQPNQPSSRPSSPSSFTSPKPRPSGEIAAAADGDGERGRRRRRARARSAPQEPSTAASTRNAAAQTATAGIGDPVGQPVAGQVHRAEDHGRAGRPGQGDRRGPGPVTSDAHRPAAPANTAVMTVARDRSDGRPSRRARPAARRPAPATARPTTRDEQAAPTSTGRESSTGQGSAGADGGVERAAHRRDRRGLAGHQLDLRRWPARRARPGRR